MRRLSEHDIAQWVRDTLLSPAREQPVVAVTSRHASLPDWIPPEDVQAALGGLAEVVYIPTGDATWALSEALPPRLDVYGGAWRIWWPGLAADADPYEHRLYLVNSPQQAQKAVGSLLAALRAPAGAAPPPSEAGQLRRPASTGAPGAPVAMRRVAPEEAPETVRVTHAALARIEVASATRRGPVVEADLPLEVLAEALQAGMEIRARPLRPRGDGTWDFSTADLLPNPWERLAAEIRPGDVVVGRVQNLHEGKKLVFVDVLPGVVGICHIRELDYQFVQSMADVVRPGELLPFEVLALSSEDRSLFLSRKRAHGQPPRPLPALVEGGRPFVWREGMPLFDNLRRLRSRAGGEARVSAIGRAARAARDGGADRRADVAALEEELAAAAAERADLVGQIRQLRQQLQDERKARRSAEDRHRELERRTASEDPLHSERAFLAGVRTCYARMLDEDDRSRWPLQRMRVGRSFLDSVRRTEGIEVDKVVEVCAQVACGMAHTVPGRDVHRLGSRGSDAIVRERDGAVAWRCALQVRTASARRLHWWQVSGGDGVTIEFASIGVHDEFDIPAE